MAGTISMAGLASGMDVSGMIDALVKANGARQSALQTRMTDTKAASTAISDISTLLSKFKTSVDALSDSNNVRSYGATSSDTALQAAVTGAANAGKYSVEVKALAKEYRAYTNPVASGSTTLGQSGTMSIQIGAGDITNINISSNDTLDSISEKINKANIGVKAATFNDGSGVRLQLRGLDTGAGNEVSVTGLDLGLNEASNKKQQAQSAHLVIDGFDVYSKTNRVVGAVPGVTLTATKETTAPANLEVNTDASEIKSKIQAVVSAYNAVVGKVQSTAGSGSTKASNAMLAGDTTLRQLTSKMSSAIMTVVGTGTNIGTLNSIGVSLNKDGTLAFDESKLNKSLSTNPDAVMTVLAGTSSNDGVMDVMSHLVTAFTRTGDGFLTNKRTTLDATAKRLQDSINSEQDRLDNYRTQLEKQFQAMDDAMTAANATSQYLTKISSG
jgi:flagellar hook-associated protein 2